MAAGPGADRNDAVDPGVRCLAGVTHADDVAEHEAAIKVDLFDQLLDRAMRRDDQRHAMPHGDRQVGREPRIALVDNEVNAEWSGAAASFPITAREAIGDFRTPGLVTIRGALVERGKGSDKAGRQVSTTRSGLETRNIGAAIAGAASRPSNETGIGTAGSPGGAIVAYGYRVRMILRHDPGAEFGIKGAQQAFESVRFSD